MTNLEKEMLEILKRVPPAMDDLMGEATGKGVVQDWGAINYVLVEISKMVRKAEAK